MSVGIPFEICGVCHKFAFSCSAYFFTDAVADELGFCFFVSHGYSVNYFVPVLQ